MLSGWRPDSSPRRESPQPEASPMFTRGRTICLSCIGWSSMPTLPKGPPMKRGFTLIELLVVITIIVVLLALLTPALDKAIYQAELAVCATHLKTIANGAALYAGEYKRRWPYRQQVMEND